MCNRIADDAAEVALLGAMIRVAACRTAVASVDRDGLFTRDAHQRLCNVILGMHHDGLHIDGVTVLVRCCDLDVIDELGGPTCVYDVMNVDACPAPSAWRSYLDVVLERAARRRRIAELRAALAELEGAS